MSLSETDLPAGAQSSDLTRAFGSVVEELREEAGLDTETVVQESGLTERRLLSLEAGESPPTLEEMAAIGQALGRSPFLLVQEAEELLATGVEPDTHRAPVGDGFRNGSALDSGLTLEMLRDGISFAYDTLDSLDATLLEHGLDRMSSVLELANLSYIVGNLFTIGVIQASDGLFRRAGPHKYQDLRSTESSPDDTDIEVKVSLEQNNPKGHLPKEGHYLTARYVLGGEDGSYERGERGPIVWIWEVRYGYLDISCFNTSNTAGDSGKTAVINVEGLQRLSLLYFDRERCPYASADWFLEKYGT